MLRIFHAFEKAICQRRQITPKISKMNRRIEHKFLAPFGVFGGLA
jgi:hypothetical protein